MEDDIFTLARDRGAVSAVSAQSCTGSPKVSILTRDNDIATLLGL